MGDRISVDKKIVVRIFLLGFLVFILFAIMQIMDYSLVQSITLTEVYQEGDIEWKIDMVRVDRHYVAIAGWAFVPGQEPRNMAVNVVLKNKNTYKAIRLPTTLVESDTINQEYPDEIDYSKSGFLARVNKNFLDLEEDSYEIYLEFINQGKVTYITTNQDLSDSTGE